MADVVVDQKPKERLPYDPNDIPDAVKRRVQAVEALYKPTNGSDGTTPPSDAPESPSVPPTETPSPQALESVPQTVAPAPAEPPSRPADDENSQSWKHRFLGMEGRYNASQKTIGELQEQMTQLGNELLHLQRMPPQSRQQQPPPPPDAPTYLTEQDEQNYGKELLDVTQRAALHAVAPHLQSLEAQNAELQARLAKEARRALDQSVEIAVPNFREIDRDPRWHRWLLGIDVLSGRVRQQLLNEAISAAAAPRVISFFRGFLNEEVATGHSEPASNSQQAAPPREAAINLSSLAAPGRARPSTGGDASVQPEKPIYTRAQVKELYRAHQKGAYVGREAEWARLEADLYAAQREGRYR